MNGTLMKSRSTILNSESKVQSLKVSLPLIFVNTYLEDQSEFFCAACKKPFKSMQAWKNHEKSKKHKQTLKKVKAEVVLDDDLEEQLLRHEEELLDDKISHDEEKDGIELNSNILTPSDEGEETTSTADSESSLEEDDILLAMLQLQQQRKQKKKSKKAAKKGVVHLPFHSVDLTRRCNNKCIGRRSFEKMNNLAMNLRIKLDP